MTGPLATPATVDAAVSGDTAPLREALVAMDGADRVVEAVTDPRRRGTFAVVDVSGVRRTRLFVGAAACVLHADGDDRDLPGELVLMASASEAAHALLAGVGFGARPEPPLRWPVTVGSPEEVVAAVRTGSLAPLGVDVDTDDGPPRWWALTWDDGAGPEVVAALDGGGWWEHRGTELVPSTAQALWARLAPFAAGPDVPGVDP